MTYSLNGKSPVIAPTAYVAPGAKLIGDVELGEEASVWFNAVLRGDEEKITIGRGSNIQDGCVVHADPGFPVTVGANVTVGHNVTLHGCTVEDGALVGMGAIVLNGAVIGKGALVAAGALVPEGKRIEPGTLVAGVPARSLGTLSDEHKQGLKRGSESYIKRGKQYVREGIMANKGTDDA